MREDLISSGGEGKQASEIGNGRQPALMKKISRNCIPLFQYLLTTRIS